MGQDGEGSFMRKMPSFSSISHSRSNSGDMTRNASWMQLHRLNGDGLALPDEADEVMRTASSISAIMWWVISSVAVVACFSTEATPWWLRLIAGAEIYVCVRRGFVGLFGSSVAEPLGGGRREHAPTRSRSRATRTEMLRFRAGAPVDALVASLMSLEGLDLVHSVELGAHGPTGLGPEGSSSRAQTHGFLWRFGSRRDRDAFFEHPDYLRAKRAAAPHIEEGSTFDFDC